MAEQSAAKAAADAKALAQQEVQQYSDKQALLGRLQAAPKYQHAAREKAASQIANPATARYQQFDDNPVKQVAQNPLATFSLDVDTAVMRMCGVSLIKGCTSARRCAGGGDSQLFPV